MISVSNIADLVTPSENAGISNRNGTREHAAAFLIMSRNVCRNIVVIGASAGGIAALREILAGLDPDLPAALLAVCHRPADSGQALVEALQDASALPCHEPEDGELIRLGHVYLAPANHHLEVLDDRALLRKGALENRVRPAIDPLFRAAAAAYSARVIGVILTGYLNDGTAGLLAVKRCAGIAIVQEPEEAQVPEMPRSAIEHVDVDHILSARQIADLLNTLVHEPAPTNITVPKDIVVEAAIAAGCGASMRTEETLGETSKFSCPDCGGVLWRIEDGALTRYRCHTGHAYTQDSLSAAQTKSVEYALWAALRALREKVALLEQLAAREKERGRSNSSARFEGQAAEYRTEAERIQTLLVETADHPLSAAAE